MNNVIYKSKQTIFRLITICLCTLTLSVNATLIEFSPESQEVYLSDQVSVDVTVNDLLNSISIGSYDLFIRFDNNRLGLNNVIFGNQLNLLGFGSDRAYSVNNGLIDIYELSFDLPDDLINYQANDFTLFTLMFDTVNIGIAEVFFEFKLQGVATNILGDQDYSIVDFNYNSAQVNVVSASTTTPVPEPAAIFLFLFALAIMSTQQSIKYKQ